MKPTSNRTLWPALYGYFDFEDVYRRFALRAGSGDVLVEVGSLVGKSACFLGEQLRERGATLVCVDTWPDTYTNEGGVTTLNPYESFRANVRQSGLDDVIVPLRMTSVRAAGLLRDGLAAVFIDANHDYEAVAADIRAWRPKVRSGGLLAGHDYGDRYPGVAKAVRELVPGHTIIGQSWIVSL